MDLSTFRARYPEFANVDDALVTSHLADAEEHVDTSLWGDRYDAGHGLYAAHLLSISPMGQGARLAADKGASTYLAEFTRQAEQVTCALRVL